MGQERRQKENGLSVVTIYQFCSQKKTQFFLFIFHSFIIIIIIHAIKHYNIDLYVHCEGTEFMAALNLMAGW